LNGVRRRALGLCFMHVVVSKTGSLLSDMH
jgi:hypothetical protein